MGEEEREREGEKEGEREGGRERERERERVFVYLSEWLAGCWPTALCCVEGLCLAELVPDGGPLFSKHTNTNA